MQRFRNISIKQKLIAIIMLTSILVLLISTGSFIISDFLGFKKKMVEEITTLADVIGANSRASLIFSDRKSGERILEALRSESQIIAGYLYSKDGTVHATYRSGDIDWDLLRSKSIGEQHDFWSDHLLRPRELKEGYQFWRDHLDLYRPVVLKNERVGMIYLQSSLQELSARLKSLASIGAVVLLGSILVAYVLSSRLQRLISGPVLYLAQKMRDVSHEENYSVRAEKWNDDELGTLIDGFNEMLDQIQNRDAALQKAHGELSERVAELQDEVSHRQRAEDRLNYLAHYDSLTNLPNRVLFVDRLGQALSRAPWRKRFVAVMFLDLDNFKRINDTLGHNVGDLLLKEVAKRLTASVRAGDAVSRLGGDEFTIILADVAQPQHVFNIARMILETVSKPYMLDKHELFLTTSIGISLFPNDGEDSETILKNADTAMYKAKELGKNNYQLYSNEMNIRAIERLSLESNLRHAVEQEEFTLHFQPIIDTKTGDILGAEALIRWQHPTLGIVSPGQFIPLAEETGLIIPIGEWVIRTACAQVKAWQDEGLPPLGIAINLSARQFQQKDLFSSVKSILQPSGFDPKYLELELTESIFLQNVESTTITLRDLHSLGIEISIDDFGTGYSSLSYLKRFPIGTLKIDQSFVRDITSDPDDAAIVNAIIIIAHSLNMKVIAEGVETEDQFQFLREHHCDKVQGFLVSRPLPAEAFKKLLKERKTQRV